jgi:endonuclease/exonuclease/phosphatase family metal-dependent hydrolase
VRPRPEPVSILQWNVENLFDTEDDPANEGDDEFTRAGWRFWIPSLYRDKVAHLAILLAAARADVVAIQEVENRRALEDLVAETARRGGLRYGHIIHRDGTDHRGVDVAALSIFPPESVRWLTPIEGQRDILCFDINPYGRPLTVIVNHWKSNWGGVAETAPMRAELGRAMRTEVCAILDAGSNAAIVVAGDFNEDVGGPAKSGAGGTSTNLAAVLAETNACLYNLHALLPAEERGTYYYARESRWNSFDNILVSAPMLMSGRGSWVVEPTSYRVLRTKFLVDVAGHPIPFRMRYNPETKRRKYVHGYSDHLPVLVHLSPR